MEIRACENSLINALCFQAEVFVLLSVLACGLTKHEYAWQPFTILVGPPGGGKSEGIGNVADCLPGSMVSVFLKACNWFAAQ